MFHAIHRTGNPSNTASSNSAGSNEVSTESREGTSRPPRPQPILVRFVSRTDSDWVWDNRKKLMNSSCFQSVFIDKNLSAESHGSCHSKGTMILVKEQLDFKLILSKIDPLGCYISARS